MRIAGGRHKNVTMGRTLEGSKCMEFPNRTKKSLFEQHNGWRERFACVEKWVHTSTYLRECLGELFQFRFRGVGGSVFR